MTQNNHATQPIGTTILVVMMEVDPADDEVFNKWYDEEHLPERMSIPGYISARRFRLEDGDELNRGGVLRYLCIWETGGRKPAPVADLQRPERQSDAHQGSGRSGGQGAGPGPLPPDNPRPSEPSPTRSATPTPTGGDSRRFRVGPGAGAG